MLEMIYERRSAEKKEERYDLFSSLLDANEQEPGEGELKLSDRELIALNPQEQEKLYQESRRVVPDGTLPSYEDINFLSYSLAVLNETLRLFPPVHSIPKSVAEDTTITITNAAGEKTTIPMPAGSNISMHIPGLHYNPRYWKDPYAFKPERFLENWPRDAFLPFSAGPRACLGRRFTETESIAVLTMISLRYEVRVLEEPQFAGETREERKARVLRSVSGVTMTPVRVPLVFKRRQPE
ncbi:hypothetical protein EIP86_001461 [Pleurotus ostreatoroseus]|nr:hypothetical protein EIP86_001461 [Pleurotus ostreatoroseus]